ncbi:hypothetical protein CR513_55673, partial [Mucuna pruriens]
MRMNCITTGRCMEHIHHTCKILPLKREGGLSTKSFNTLQEHYECHDLIDSIVLNDIDHSNERIVGELEEDGKDAEDELVFDDDILTWKDIASAIGIAEPLKYTRRQTQMQRAATASTSWKEKGKGVVEEEDEDESSHDEGEEEYNSCSNRRITRAKRHQLGIREDVDACRKIPEDILGWN